MLLFWGCLLHSLRRGLGSEPSFTLNRGPSFVRVHGLVRIGARVSAWAPPGSGNLRILAEFGLAMAGVIWGGNFVLVKAALGHMPPLYYIGLRFLVGAVLLAPISAGRLRRIDVRGLLLGCGVGVLLFGGFVLQTVGLKSVSPGMSGFITNLYVLAVPLMIGIATGRWPSPLVGVGVVVVVGGFAVLSLYGRLGFGLGEALTLAAVVFWSLHILAVGHMSARMSAIALVQIQLAVCAVLSLIFAFVFEHPVLFPGWAGMGMVLWTGIMGSLVAYVLMAWGQRYTPPTLAGVLMSLEAVFALVVSIIWGYDTLTWRTVMGFILVFAGCTVARMGSDRTPEYAVEPAPPGP